MADMHDAAVEFAQNTAPQDYNVALRSMLVEVFEAGAKWRAEQAQENFKVSFEVFGKDADEEADQRSTVYPGTDEMVCGYRDGFMVGSAWAYRYIEEGEK